MVREQLQSRGIVDEAVLAAMTTVPRERFVPAAQQACALADHALPIELGQSISQPFMVAYMTQALRLDAACRVLEIGTGSGYQAGVLATIVARVYTVERLAPLQQAARALLDSLGYDNIEYHCGDGSVGWPAHAPYDRIVVTAAAPRVPPALTAQLGEGGLLVAPVGEGDEQVLVRIRRTAAGTVQEPLLPCRFVRLIGEQGFP